MFEGGLTATLGLRFRKSSCPSCFSDVLQELLEGAGKLVELLQFLDLPLGRVLVVDIRACLSFLEDPVFLLGFP